MLYNKFNYKKIKPFRILEKISIVNYKLELLEIIRINLVFYISLLELVLLNVKTFAPELDKKVNKIIKYKVEKVIKRTK